VSPTVFQRCDTVADILRVPLAETSSASGHRWAKSFEAEGSLPLGVERVGMDLQTGCRGFGHQGGRLGQDAIGVTRDDLALVALSTSVNLLGSRALLCNGVGAQRAIGVRCPSRAPRSWPWRMAHAQVSGSDVKSLPISPK
jgi:hypothetical protein